MAEELVQMVQAMKTTLDGLVVDMKKVKDKSDEVLDEDMKDDDMQPLDDACAAAGWGAVLHTPLLEVHSNAGKSMVRLMQDPPPLETLRHTMKDSPKYKGMPTSAPPRRHKVDQKWAGVQKKMEDHMNVMLHFHETKDETLIHVAEALVRSAWQDCQENRREFLAGKQSHHLEKRPDENKNKLLNPEEEKKIRNANTQEDKQQKPLFQNRQTWNRWSRSRSRSPGKGKGKGNGKGKGKGRQTL